MIMVSTTHIVEMVKLPFVISHYLEHRRADAQMSLLDFINLHYMKNQTRDADFDKDMKLPFKTLVHDHTASQLYTPCIHFVTSASLELRPGEKVTPIYLASPGLSFASPVWQPPKYC